MKSRLAFALAVFAAALALRLPRLSDRPMHADEAILADKFGTLLETGSYKYDPANYHGPLLAWLTLPAARIAGAHRYADLTEPVLRIVPVVCGLALVVMALWLGGALAGALTALSPAMVYYSRYYIPEMPLAALSFAVIVLGCRYAVSRKPAWALAAGGALGLTFATKETAGIAAACMALAYVVAVRRMPDRFGPVLAGLAVAAVVAVGALGPANLMAAIPNYAGRGLHDALHRHPWYFYFAELGLPEAPILLLAAAGAAIAWRGKDPLMRFLAAYTCAMAAVYAAVPYKTPWCALQFLQPAMVLAGAALARVRPRYAAACACAAALYLGVEAWRLSFPYSSDPRNPYVYAHTGRGVYAIRDTVLPLAGIAPVQVVSEANLWPLPWYLRSAPRVEWWRGVRPGFRPAGVVIATPDMEPALVREIYEAPPPGQRELYVPLFDRDVELRPGVEVLGYVASRLRP